MSKDNIGNFHDPGDFEDDDEEKDEAWKPENILATNYSKSQLRYSTTPKLFAVCCRKKKGE